MSTRFPNDDSVIAARGDDLFSIPQSGRKLVFIDGALDRLDILLAGVAKDFTAIVINPARDGVEQIADVLRSGAPVEALHIVSHGTPGVLHLGSSQLAFDSVDLYAPQLARIRAGLDDDASVVIYGCSAGAGPLGESFVDALSDALDADVSASTTKTGAQSLGGDWTFDVGAEVTAMAFTDEARAAYPAVMATIDGGPGPDVIDRSGSGEFDTINGGDGGDTITAGPQGAFITVDGVPANGVNTVGFADTVILGAANDTVSTYIVDITDGDTIRNFQAFDGTDGDLFFVNFDEATIVSQTLEAQPGGGFDLLLELQVNVPGFGPIIRTQRFEDTVGTFEITSSAFGVGTDFRLTAATLPAPSADAFSVDVNQTVGGNLLDNDSLPGGGTPSVSRVNGTTTIGAPVTLGSGAVVTVNADGTFTYDPNGAFDNLAQDQSDTDSFTYTLSDGQGGSAPATVTLTITNGNNPPSAQDDTIAALEDDVFNGDVFADNGNGVDTDLDGDGFTVTWVNGTANVGIPVDLTNGSVTLNANGTFSYTPDPGFVGQETFTYTITDDNSTSDSATVTITVNGVNDAPVAQDDTFSIDAGGMLDGDVKDDNGNGQDADEDAGDTLSFAVSQDVANGTLVFNNSTGIFIYVPDDGFAGVDTFTYTATDSQGATDTATVTINVISTQSDYSASIAVDTQAEGGLGDTTTYTFTVTRTGDTSSAGTVDYAVGPGVENGAGADDIADAFPFGTLSFAADETTKTVTVTVTGDIVPEAPETFDLDLSNPTNAGGTAVLGTASVTATIANDDLATITGSNSKDNIKGSDNDDVISAGDGDDKVKGQDGDDVIIGGDGDDKLDGGDDDDVILGGDGDDKIKDKDGDTIVDGGDGDDSIKVKDGDTIIDGGSGDDEIKAGKGDDIFIFKAGNDKDEIKKFGKDGRDKIDLSSFNGLTFAQFEDQADQDGKDLIWETSDGDELILLKVDIDDLSANDFIFSS